MSFSSYDLCGPNPNPMTRAEVDGLKKLVRDLRSHPVIINIGAERGTSTLAMLEERSDAFIFSIDVGQCEKEFDNLRKANLDWHKVVRVLGRSQNIGKYWPYNYDFVFIDGDHSEQGVRGDIEAWVKNINPMGGIVAFHDYIPEPIPPEIKGRVVYAVDDMMKSQEEILWVERLKAFKIP
jgi:predicted O-methyltransferase YrrM